METLITIIAVIVVIINIILIVMFFKLCGDIKALKEYLVDGVKYVHTYDKHVGEVNTKVFAEDLITPTTKEAWEAKQKEKTENMVKALYQMYNIKYEENAEQL